MSWLQWYFAAVAVLTLLLFVMLFGSLPQFEDTFISRLRDSLKHGIQLIIAFDERFLAGLFTKTLLPLISSYKRQLLYLIPLGYCLVVTGSLYMFIRDCYPLLHNPPATIITLTCILPYIVTTIATFSDPGRLDSERKFRSALSRFENDRIIFYPGNICTTCRIEKPARSKHCSDCDSCIAVCDHHCIWINNCVGYYNYRWFLLFLLANMNMLLQGFYYTVTILNEARSTNSKTTTTKINWLMSWIAAAKVSKQTKTSAALCFLTFFTGILVTAFLAIHLRYIYQGTTTNEVAKWDDISDCITDKSLYMYKYPDTESRDLAHASGVRDIVVQRYADGNYNRAITQHEYELVQQYNLKFGLVDSYEDLQNIYDQGFWANLQRIVLPEPL